MRQWSKTFPLAKHFKRITGVDSSESMIDAAKLANVHKNVKFIIGDFAATGIAANSVDAVTMWNSLHFANPDTLIPELARVLRPTGLIYICEPGSDSKYSATMTSEMIQKKVRKITRIKNKFVSDGRVHVVKFNSSASGFTLIAKIK